MPYNMGPHGHTRNTFPNPWVSVIYASIFRHFHFPAKVKQAMNAWKPPEWRPYH